MTAWNTTSGPGFTLFFGYPEEASYAEAVQRLVDERIASRIAARDETVWGPAAEAEAGKRLGWVQLASTSRPLVDEILELRAKLQGQGLTRVVLCGMGGSSLAPEVICESAGLPIERPRLLRPRRRAPALERPTSRTPSWSCPARAAAPSRPTASAGPSRRPSPRPASSPAERIVVVTDPGSPLDHSATEAGYRVFRADPEVGGRYSALTAFGLVPSGWPGPTSAPSSTRPPSSSRRSRPMTPTTPVSGWAHSSAWPTTLVSTSWCWPTAARPTPASATGPSSWSPSPPARTAPGILPVVVEGTDAPELPAQHRRRGAGHVRSGGA